MLGLKLNHVSKSGHWSLSAVAFDYKEQIGDRKCTYILDVMKHTQHIKN